MITILRGVPTLQKVTCQYGNCHIVSFSHNDNDSGFERGLKKVTSGNEYEEQLHSAEVCDESHGTDNYYDYDCDVVMMMMMVFVSEGVV